MQLATRIHIIHIQIWYFSNPVHESRIFLPNILPRRGTFHPHQFTHYGTHSPRKARAQLHLSYSIYYSIILSEIAVSAFSSGLKVFHPLKTWPDRINPELAQDWSLSSVSYPYRYRDGASFTAGTFSLKGQFECLETSVNSLGQSTFQVIQ